MAILGGVTTCLCHSFVAPAEDGGWTEEEPNSELRYLCSNIMKILASKVL